MEYDIDAVLELAYDARHRSFFGGQDSRPDTHSVRGEDRGRDAKNYGAHRGRDRGKASAAGTGLGAARLWPGMEPTLFSLPYGVALAAAVLAGAVVVAAQTALQRRADRRRSEGELLRYSNLHLLTAKLNASGDLEQTLQQALAQTLAALETEDGFLLFRSPPADEKDYTRARGLSPATISALAGGPLRTYLVSFSERWGNLIVFPDLRRPELQAVWPRDPEFKEFCELCGAEGLRTLAAVGLRINEKPHGELVVASRKPRVFHPGELRLLLAIGNQISVTLENYFLHLEAERRTEEMRVLHRVGEALSSTFDLERQLQVLRHELRGLLGNKVFWLVFQDLAEQDIRTAFSSEEGDKGSSQDDPLAVDLCRYVIRTRIPLLINRDMANEARRLGLFSSPTKMSSWAGVPVHFSDGSVAVLAVADFAREHALNEAQFQLLRVLAGEVAVAIDNARLFQREQQRARHLALLNELGRKAAAVLDPGELCRSIVRQIRHAFGYDYVRIETLSEGDLVVAAAEGYEDDLRERRFRVGEGFSGLAVETGEPVLSNDVEQDERFQPVVKQVRSAASLPLRFAGETLGVLSLESRVARNFSSQDVLTLRTLADQLATALHNAHAYKKAQDQAITDGLTGLKTHRYFRESLEAEWRRAPRAGRPFSLIMLDLDYFKNVNDCYGHLEGDKVLVTVARCLEANSRQSNIIARYGGDEFAVLAPETTCEQAEVLAERLRASVATDLYLETRGVTASFGIATFPNHGTTPEEIIRVADSGVYLAKHHRGNRVRVAPQVAETASEWEQQLLEAYLGVAVKRMFSTGPEAFNLYLRRFEEAMRNPQGSSLSLLDAVTALAFAIDAKDHYTQGHSQSVSRLAAQTARELGLTETEIEEIRLGGILHDIGKIGVPETVLNKPARLTREEFEVMKNHAPLGDRILEPLKVKAIERIRRIVRHHHEAFDGGGYPDRLRGDNIPLGARILTIADAFDTMISQRAYKEGRTVEEAIAELRRCCGSQFDRELVENFVKALEAVADTEKRTAFEAAAS